MLYYHGNVEEQGFPIDQAFVDRMLQATTDWGLYSRSLAKSKALLTALLLIDMDEYLPKATKQWCEDRLAELGFSHDETTSTNFNSAVQMRHHETAYRLLRLALQKYLRDGARLEETSPPYGGVAWKPTIHKDVDDAYNDRTAQPHAPEQMDFPDDGLDQSAKPEDFEEQLDFDEEEAFDN